MKAAAALMMAIAGLATGCGDGLLANGGKGSGNGPALVLKVASVSGNASTSGTFATLPSLNATSIPLSNGAYAGNDLSPTMIATIQDFTNVTPVTVGTNANGYLQALTYCFDVSGLDLTQYSSIEFDGSVAAGINQVNRLLPPTSGLGFTARFWDQRLSGYDSNQYSIGDFSYGSVKLSSDAGVPLSQMAVYTAGVVSRCIFVTILGNDASNGADNAVISTNWVSLNFYR